MDMITRPATFETGTMTDVILAHARAQRADATPGMIFASEGGETRLSYQGIADAALRVAHALRERGLVPGDVIFIALPSSADFLVPFCGAVLAGCLPCCVPAPADDSTAAEFSAHLNAAIDTLTPRLMVVTPALAQCLRTTGDALSVATIVELRSGARLELGDCHHAQPDDLHHLQLTSGSTGQPKAAALTHRNVIANILLTARAGKTDPSRQRAVLWLPLFHDMGLIGALSGLVHGIDVVMQAPDEFIRNPMSWLRNLSRYRGTASAAPNFALAYCVRRFRADLLQGVDLGGFHSLVVGAERVHPETLRKFVATFAPYGFRADMLFPCYGLAELTLAVTVPDGRHHGPLGRNTCEQHVEAKGQSAEIAARIPAEPAVGLGPPLEFTDIQIRDPAGLVLADGLIGEIHVRSVCLMREYFRDPVRTRTVIRDGFYATGDLGWLRHGELFVLGRMKELIILRGRNYYPHEFEECVARHPMVDVGRVAAFGVADARLGSERLVVVVEPGDYRGLAHLRQELQERLRAQFGFGATELSFVRRGAIPRTTSRKIQRVECARLFTSGALPALAIEDPVSATRRPTDSAQPITT